MNSDECVNFKTKLEIAFDEIIEPLKVPKGMNLCIVFDSLWSSEELINKCINLGHSVVCQIKSDRKVGINKFQYHRWSKFYWHNSLLHHKI